MPNLIPQVEPPWVDIFGQTQQHTTAPKEGDTRTTLTDRHAAIIAGLKRAFPPAS